MGVGKIKNTRSQYLCFLIIYMQYFFFFNKRIWGTPFLGTPGLWSESALHVWHSPPSFHLQCLNIKFWVALGSNCWSWRPHWCIMRLSSFVILWEPQPDASNKTWLRPEESIPLLELCRMGFSLVSADTTEKGERSSCCYPWVLKGLRALLHIQMDVKHSGWSWADTYHDIFFCSPG